MSGLHLVTSSLKVINTSSYLLAYLHTVSVRGRLDVNVALNRPSYQSSVHSPPGLGPQAAHQGNDGGNSTFMDQGSCINTEYELNPWWAVDLSAPLHVAGVKFTNRGDYFGTFTASFLSLALL